MAIGSVAGEFSLKATSVTYRVGAVEVNYDGSASGFGRVQGTMTFVVSAPEAKSGTCSWNGAAYMDNGEVQGGSAEGTWEEIGKHMWRVRGINYLTDGRSFATDGEVDLATDSYTGQLFEWS